MRTLIALESFPVFDRLFERWDDAMALRDNLPD
jgi:hypothetical protein